MAAAFTPQLHSRNNSSSHEKQSPILKPKVPSFQQQVSFHLKLHDKEIDLKIGNQSSAQYLRQAFDDDQDKRFDFEPWNISEINQSLRSHKHKNPANVLLEVWVQKLILNSEVGSSDTLTWQPRLLVLASKCLFILRNGSNGDLEIVDSIPMHEVDTAGAISALRIADSHLPGSSFKSVSRSGSNSMEYLMQDEDTYNSRDKHQRMKDKYDRLLLRSNPNLTCLRITTIPEGLNDGWPYYFLFGQTNESSASDVAKRNESLKKVADEITKLAKAQKQSVALKVRFRRFQAALQTVWQSLAFNIAIMILIVSNFAFTVRGMGIDDPDDLAFFEQAGLCHRRLTAA